MRKYRRELGLFEKLDIFQEEHLEEVELLRKLVEETMFYSNEPTKNYFNDHNYGPLDINISFKELLKRPNNNPIVVLDRETKRFGVSFSVDTVRTVAISVKYEGYIDRAIIESEKINRLGKKKITWESLVDSKNISFECKLRIKTIRPETFAQLQRIEGIRPATLAYVAGNII